jgi:hypothetical protein
VTPREQLIEAMRNRQVPREDAEQAVQALSDLGAVVLMPVEWREIDEDQRYCPHVGWERRPPRPPWSDDTIVFVDALEADK